jgi:hypothetical protein
MTKEEMADLSTGDIVRHADSEDLGVVIGNYGDHVTAARIFDITNPTEWVVVMKASYARQESPP